MRQVMQRASGGQGSIKVGVKMELSLYPVLQSSIDRHAPGRVHTASQASSLARQPPLIPRGPGSPLLQIAAIS